MTSEYTFHLIANAHLDPVWLWDWREGLNEGLITCRTVLDLMDEDPELTFIRGESAIYQHIERTDPPTFQRIRKYVKEGRWDVVGGSVIQPDTNLPAAETQARHYLHGQRYFQEKFGRTVRAGWAADSFGHAAGLPEVLVNAGIEAFAFTRPAAGILPIAKPAFWWEGPRGREARVLAYRPMVGWYGSERTELPGRLDELLSEAHRYGLHNVGVFYGLGDHGGGPTRAMLKQIREWSAKHPRIRMLHSGLHRFFDDLRSEVKKKGDDFIPTHRGEMNFTLRGCYSSVAKYKFAYRRTEALLGRAERAEAAISARIGQAPAGLHDAWETVLFNSFHDILPGTSIERAYVDQLAWLGIAFHRAQAAEFGALNELAMRIDTRVSPPAGEDMPAPAAALLWNPHPWPFQGHIELEAPMDYRFIAQYDDRPDALPVQVLGPDRRPLPFQLIATEHASVPRHAWRKRAVIQVKLPPMGWAAVEMGWVEDPRLAPAPALPARAEADGVLDNGRWRISARPGSSGILFQRDRRKLFGRGGLSAIVCQDPFGSWGDMKGPPEQALFDKVIETWPVQRVQVLESGPQRATMWVRLAGKRSWIELTIRLYQGRDAAEVLARVLWNERSARLKLSMPCGAQQAEYEVPGASLVRGEVGEVPGGRWVRVRGKEGSLGFASDALYNFDISHGAFHATVVRASRYGADRTMGPEAEPWRAAVDSGELTFRFVLSPGGEELEHLAGELECPPVGLLVPAKRGELPRSGSLLWIRPESLELLALKGAEDGKGLILRLRQRSGRSVRPKLRWLGKPILLDRLEGQAIGTWRLMQTGGRWRSRREDILERADGGRGGKRSIR